MPAWQHRHGSVGSLVGVGGTQAFLWSRKRLLHQARDILEGREGTQQASSLCLTGQPSGAAQGTDLSAA